MNPLFDQLLGDIGCSLDATSSNNPITRWATNVIDSGIDFQEGTQATSNTAMQYYQQNQQHYDVVEKSEIMSRNSNNYDGSQVSD